MFHRSQITNQRVYRGICCLAPVLLLVLIALHAVAVAADYSDCVQTTIKDIKCPSVTETNCGAVVKKKVELPVPIPSWLPNWIQLKAGQDIPWCESITWQRAETDAFGTKTNTPNETETQTDTDAADMVTCRTYGYCVPNPKDPASCIQTPAGTADANPQEEIPCVPKS